MKSTRPAAGRIAIISPKTVATMTSMSGSVWALGLEPVHARREFITAI
jgi:hypothetical protein